MSDAAVRAGDLLVGDKEISVQVRGWPAVGVGGRKAQRTDADLVQPAGTRLVVGEDAGQGKRSGAAGGVKRAGATAGGRPQTESAVGALIDAITGVLEGRAVEGHVVWCDAARGRAQHIKVVST